MTVNHTLCADRIGGGLDRLYHWAPIREFLAAVMNKTALFVMDDPLARHNVMAYRTGERLNWHFDRSEFTTTLLLQASQAATSLKTAAICAATPIPDFDGAARLLEDRDAEKRARALSPGTLIVFRGRNTAHRVTPVIDDTDRIIAVFCCYEAQGVRFSARDSLGFYGRTAEA